jgi:hypothetical protein
LFNQNPTSMKNFTFLIITFLIIGLVPAMQAQEQLVNGGFEAWQNDNTPEGWNITDNIDKESTIVRSGDFSARQTAPESSNRKLQQVISGIEPGAEYTITYHFLDNDDAARMRIWSYWLSGTSTLPDNEDVLRPSTYSTNSADWQEFTAVITAPAGADGFRFEMRIYAQDGNGGGYIYYDDFSFSSDVVVKPEPTNYPTAFVAEAEGFGARLSWTDATGSQLPDAYLILGEIPVSAKSVPVFPPVDGTPVPNNMDISLGYIAMNVPYGVEEYLFQFLEGDTDYHFEIYPYTNSGANIDYKTDGSIPQAFVTTNDFSILFHETFDDDLGAMEAVSVSGEQEWTHYTFNDENYARMNGYAGGQSNVNEDWLISPALDLSSYEDVVLNFRAATNFVGPELQLMISEDYDGQGNPNDFSWTDYSDAADWSSGNYEWVHSGDIGLNLSGSTVSIAFKYTSTADDAAVWQVDDILVYGEELVGLSENPNTIARFWPNPVSDVLNLSLMADAEVGITDITGRTVFEASLKQGENQLNISQLIQGAYVIKIKSVDGKIAVSKLVVR